jgi:hypothetical protein
MLFASPLAAQQIIQSGKPPPGHAGKWVTNLTLGDAGAANGGPAGTGLTELNITSTLNNGLPFCINDAPITGPYHQLCMGAGGLVSYNGFGGAPPQGLTFNVNGGIYSVPGTGAGLGNVSGPASSIAIELASFADTTGKLLRQGPAHLTDNKTTGPLTGSSTALVVTSDGTLPDAEIGSNVNYQAIAGVSNLPPGTSGLVNVVGVSGFVTNNAVSPSGAGPNAVALYGWAQGKVANSWTWGINTNILTMAGLSAGGTLYNEFDLSAFNANDVIIGLQLAGDSRVQPLSAVGVLVGTQHNSNLSTARWTVGFMTQTGSTPIALLAEPALAGNSQASAAVEFQATNATGGAVNYGIASSATSLNFFPGAGAVAPYFYNFNGGLSLTPGNIITINNQSVVANTANQAQFGIDPAITQVSLGNATAPVLMPGLPATPGGKQPVCFDLTTHQLYHGTTGAC